MSKSPTEQPHNTILADLRHEIRRGRRALGEGWAAAGVELRNSWKRARNLRLDYVVLPIGGPLPERNGPRRGFIERRLPLPADPLSLQTLNYILQDVADAGNVRGVVFIFRDLSAGLASLQNLRAAIGRLRAAGKEAIVYTPYLDLAHYYVATAADRIVAPPGARFEVLGLYSEVTFLKDALARVGLSAEVVQISPYKTAYDRLSRADISPEYREQLDWQLDDLYDQLTAGMAAGRYMTQATLKEWIDRAPFAADEARAAGLIDHVAYDDELADWLGQVNHVRPDGGKEPAQKTGDPASSRPAILKTGREARKLLLERVHHYTTDFIGVISLEGLITMGPSRQPPIDLPIPLLGGATAGEQTIVSLLRRVERLDDMAALVLHVDSGGGSALASELIGRQIEQLAAKKPVVVYMGNVAASGGYYVAAPAAYIMSQPATITGSIGVIMARVSASGLYDQLAINRVSLSRGEHAGLYRDTDPWSESERAIFSRQIDDIYGQFRDVVVRGRHMTAEQVDEVGLGRVWTGRQALTHGLVDGYGDFLDAIKKAAELAALPVDDSYTVSVSNFFARSAGYVLPAARAASILTEANRLLSGAAARELTGQPLMLLPTELRFR